MKHGKLIGAVMLVAGVGLADAQAQNSPPNAPTDANNPMAPDNTMNATAPGATHSFSSWANDYSKSHQGRISRQAYMDEAGRRWDAMDKGGQGLTTSEIGRLNGWSSAGTGLSGPGGDKAK